MNERDAALAAPETTNDLPTIWRVDDALWAELQPLLVVDKPRTKPGRPRSADRPIVAGLIGIARSGGQWAALPRACGPQAAVHGRFQEWVAHGCFAPAWARFLEAYDDEIGSAWQWQAADGCLVKAPLGNKGGPARRRGRGRTPRIAGNAAPSATS